MDLTIVFITMLGLLALAFFILVHDRLKSTKAISNYVAQVSDLESQLEYTRKELMAAKKIENKSQELTEFLSDFKSHGYSFVRVDPGAVFVRSPREL